MTPIPLSLYIHIPWCVKKCPYCDFNSHEVKQIIQEELYIQALMKDLESHLPSIWGRPLESIFIGGGTPSIFSKEAIDLMMRGLRERLPLRPNMEITLEANPGTFDQEKFSGFFDSGINRLSIGIQSFNNHHLKKLGRIHNSNEALRAIDIARNAGFEKINLDIMYGLPEQNITEALEDLKLAINTKPEHISWYQLTIEENTLFHHSPPANIPRDDISWEMQLQGQQLLKTSGYNQYEVSAYSKENQQCRHNINYWEFGDYLGIGAGAHSKLSMPDGKIIRHCTFRHPNQYIEQALNGKTCSTKQELTEHDLIFEFILNTIRLKKGFNQKLFETRTHLSFSKIQKKVDKLIKDKLLAVKKPNNYITTDKGWCFINSITENFLE